MQNMRRDLVERNLVVCAPFQDTAGFLALMRGRIRGVADKETSTGLCYTWSYQYNKSRPSDVILKSFYVRNVLQVLHSRKCT
jgi:hypothetical protein